MGLLDKALVWVSWSLASYYLIVVRPFPLWVSVSPSVKWIQATSSSEILQVTSQERSGGSLRLQGLNPASWDKGT